jgi:hypothetical protein
MMFKRSILALSAAALVTLSAVTTAHADDEMAKALATLDAQLPGTLINNPYDIEWRTEGSDKKDSVVKSEGAPGGMAYRVTVKKRKKNAWDTATRIPMTTDINKGDVILMSFWARTEKPQKGKETGNISVSIQRKIEPYDSVIQEDIDLGTEWKLLSVSGKASRDYSAKKTQINFNLARAKQTIEFGQFYVMNLGPDGDASKYTEK